MSGMIGRVKELGNTLYDVVLRVHRRRTELRKMQDKRRVAIYGEVHLSDEQISEVNRIYGENYGERIPLVWHRYFTAYTGKFDAAYFPDLLAIPELERYMNPYSEYVRILGEKNVLPMLASAAGVKMPKTVASLSKGMWRDGDYRTVTRDEALALINAEGRVFVKPAVDTSSGEGCAVLDVENGIDRISKKPVGEIIDSMGSDVAVQRLLKCHESISALYPNSVNTFRIMTYRWNGVIEHCPAIMRIGRGGGFVDNAHAGGMFVAIDDDGVLHSTAFTEFMDRFTVHPDTGVVFDGYRIESFGRAIEAAKRMHYAMPQLGVVHWDFTIDENGEPVMIEANSFGGGVWIVQMAHGRSLFGEKTADILRYIAKMKRLTPKQREGHYWQSVD